jgi:hypothetical protein
MTLSVTSNKLLDTPFLKFPLRMLILDLVRDDRYINRSLVLWRRPLTTRPSRKAESSKIQHRISACITNNMSRSVSVYNDGRFVRATIANSQRIASLCIDNHAPIHHRRLTFFRISATDSLKFLADGATCLACIAAIVKDRSMRVRGKEPDEVFTAKRSSGSKWSLAFR